MNQAQRLECFLHFHVNRVFVPKTCDPGAPHGAAQERGAGVAVVVHVGCAPGTSRLQMELIQRR